jgi:hypothetical protein
MGHSSEMGRLLPVCGREKGEGGYLAPWKAAQTACLELKGAFPLDLGPTSLYPAGKRILSDPVMELILVFYLELSFLSSQKGRNGLNWLDCRVRIVERGYRRISISGTTFSGKKCLSGTIFHAI